MAIYRMETTDVNRPLWSESKQPRWASANSYYAGDAHHTAIVRASSEPDARATAADGAGAEGKEAWLDESTTAERILAGPSEVLGVL